jgi:RNA polymerase-binding transcription factor DksA
VTTIVEQADGPTPSARFCGTDAHLRALWADLEQRRCFRVAQLRQLTTPVPPETSSERDAAHAAVTIALRTAATVALREVEEALGRIKDGSYGACQACDTAIPLPTLQALPMVRWCGSCEQAHVANDSVRLETRRLRCAQAAPDLVEVWGHGSFPASDPPANW